MLLKKLRNSYRLIKIFFNPLFYNGKIIRKLPYTSVVNRIVVHPEKKFVFIRIPKAANSTVIALLWNKIHGQIINQNIRTKKFKKSFRTAIDLNIEESMNAKKHYYFFTIVRNPFDRVLSAYLQKFRSEIYQKRYARDIYRFGDGNINFYSFCKFLEKKGLYKDPHWLPQCEFIWPNIHRINYIGKFENLNKDLINIFNFIFEDSEIDLSKYYGPGKTDAFKMRSLYYNKECQELIYNLYYEDFITFNYINTI